MACNYLIEQGLIVIDRNFRSRIGEIDIVALDSDVLVFIEVKYRKTASAGYPEEAVNIKKIKTICKVSDYYRIVNQIPANKQLRFDVVSICQDEIKWHKNAFPYI